MLPVHHHFVQVSNALLVISLTFQHAINKTNVIYIIHLSKQTHRSDIHTGLTIVIEDQPAELPLQDGFVASSKTCQQTDRRPHIQAKSDMVEADGCKSDRGETRKWVVCEGGVLIEENVNHPDMCVDLTQDSIEIVDQNEQNTDETASTVQPCIRFVCTEKSTQSSPSDCHYKTNTSEYPSTSSTRPPTPSVLGHHQNSHTDAQPNTCGNVYTFAVCAYAKQPVRPYRPLSHGCCICGQKFRSSSVLTEHQRTHTEVNWFVCYTCGESFKTPEDFLRHEKTHVTTVKTRQASKDSLLLRRHLCSTCGELFNRSDTLHAHERMHERSIHVCSTCGHSFTTMSKLYRHAKSHWNDPHICDICGKSFSKPRFLKSHTKMAHTRGTRGKRFSAEYLVKLRKKINTYVQKRSSRGKALTKCSERARAESVAGVCATNLEPHINPVSSELFTPSSSTYSSDQSNPIDKQSSCSKTSHADTSHTPNQMIETNTKQYNGEKRNDETISRVDATCAILKSCVTSSPACSEPSSDDQINEIDEQYSCTKETDTSHTPNQMIQTKTNHDTGEKRNDETISRVDATCPVMESCVTSSPACSEPSSDDHINEVDDQYSCIKEAEALPNHELNQVTQTFTKRYTGDKQHDETIPGVSVSLTKSDSGSSVCTEQSTPTSPRSDGDDSRVVQKQSACKGPPKVVKNPQSIRKRASLAVSRKRHYPTCSACGKVFKNSRLLETHGRIHKNVSVPKSPLIPKPFVCTTCERSFVLRRELHTHENDVHSVKRYKCAKCMLSFRTFYGLKNHKAKIHPGLKVRYTDIRTDTNNCASVLRAEKYIQSRCYQISCSQPPVCVKVNHSVRVTSRFVKSPDTCVSVSEHL